MKKLFYVRTTGYDMVVSVDEENNCRYITENSDFPTEKANAREFLENIEDDSSWDSDCTYDEIFEDAEIVDAIEKEI